MNISNGTEERQQASIGHSHSTIMPPKLSNSRYHPDVIIFLFLIPIISGINYYLTYSNIRFNWFFLLTFCIDTVQGYAAWWIVKEIILYLDKLLPFERYFVVRLVVQLTTTMLSGLAVIAALTELVSIVAKGRTAPLDFYTIDLVIISIWFLVINGIYVALYYVNLSRDIQYSKPISTDLPVDTESATRGSALRESPIIARVGRETLKVDADQLAGLFVDEHYVIAVTTSGKKHVLDQSLDKLERSLPSENFFRVNRQYILSRSAISGFRRLDNGKLSVLVRKIEWLPSEVPMSRIRASAFKEWFHIQD
ncbi:LytTR family DNA-binding domain-containing protein [Chryseolinea sp. T2]|uniref:LytR/AlgR family response regulator transcription factor n=1 Tax=Chryseolinea sp. T2 TaxID=3129255 RepID=UPI0030770A6F